MPSVGQVYHMALTRWHGRSQLLTASCDECQTSTLAAQLGATNLRQLEAQVHLIAQHEYHTAKDVASSRWQFLEPSLGVALVLLCGS